MANGAPTNKSDSRPIKFKRRFKPKKVEIDGKDEATYVFETAPVYKSVERELNDAFADIEDENEGTEENVMFEVVGALIDKLVVPVGGKKKKASEVLKELWDADLIEFADVTDFLGSVSTQRRPN